MTRCIVPFVLIACAATNKINTNSKVRDRSHFTIRKIAIQYIQAVSLDRSSSRSRPSEVFQRAIMPKAVRPVLNEINLLPQYVNLT